MGWWLKSQALESDKTGLKFWLYHFMILFPTTSFLQHTSKLQCPYSLSGENNSNRKKWTKDIRRVLKKEMYSPLSI